MYKLIDSKVILHHASYMAVPQKNPNLCYFFESDCQI